MSAQHKILENQMALAIKEAGVSTKKPAQILLTKEQEVVLVCDFSLDEMPEGISILPAGNGSASIQKKTSEQFFYAVEFDVGNFLKNCGIQTIKPCKQGEESVRVYINCLAGVGNNSRGKNVHSPILEMTLNRVWGRVRLMESEERVSLVLKYPKHETNRKETIQFAIR